jgi:hypothetical protein
MAGNLMNREQQEWVNGKREVPDSPPLKNHERRPACGPEHRGHEERILSHSNRDQRSSQEGL